MDRPPSCAWWPMIGGARVRLRIGGIVALMAIMLSCPATFAGAEDFGANRSDLIRGLLPTVVNIAVRKEVPSEARMASTAVSVDAATDVSKSYVGSGFIIDPSGLIVTNYHVVEDAYEISVTLSDGTVLPGKLLHASRTADLAVVQVQPDRKLTPVEWGDSTKVRVGDQVFAIGNPLGIGTSVSGGIVSGLNRNVADSPYDDYIQTDAAINHGNSGGPLFDMEGRSYRHGHRHGLADRRLRRPRPRHSVRQRTIRRRPADEIWLGPPGMDGREGAAGHAGDGRGDGNQARRLGRRMGYARQPRPQGRHRDRRCDPEIRRRHAGDERALLRDIGQDDVGETVRSSCCVAAPAQPARDDRFLAAQQMGGTRRADDGATDRSSTSPPISGCRFPPSREPARQVGSGGRCELASW